MKYGSERYRANMAEAKRMADPDRTIAVLMDERPGFSPEAARQLICAMMEMGYLVHEIGAEEFCTKDITSLGFLLVLPHAESVPAMCAKALENYWKQGGRVLTLGGPLFAHLVERHGDGFVDVPLGDQVLDAAISGKMYPIVMEGFTPSYKVYEVADAAACMTEPDQRMVTGNVSLQAPERVVCPSARPHGLGYGMEHRNRYIPLIQMMGEGGRAEGRRGALAYIMLSDVRMKRLGVDGNRFGYVMPTTRGACGAGIGWKRQDILNVPGMRGVLEELLRVLHRGLYLFEAGSDRFVTQPGEKMRLGAKILNQNAEYLPVRVEFRVQGARGEAFFAAREELALPGDMTEISVDFAAPAYGEYTVETRLVYENEEIDCTEHAFSAPEKKQARPEEFVRVQNGEFMLGEKPWFAFGINYWPHYYPGFEFEDYWMGWLDKANYDPLEVERDMALMEEMGLNCLFTRVDGNVMGRSIDTLKDFLLRCERHGMKLSLSYCNVTSPLHYQPEAFRRFLKAADLLDNPVLFSHDLAWEVGSKFYSPQFMNTWDRDWANWIVDRYGSIANAEADWGMPVDRSEDGSVVAPPIEQFHAEGPWRIKVCAYRRFIDDFASRKWNDAVSDIRRVDPKHLIAYRMGPIGENSAALTATCKHIDFSSPEGYSVSNDENGVCNASAIALALEMTTRGKPVVWSEYGLSLTDVRWRKLVWDNENSRPFHWKEEEQTEYLRKLYRVFEATNVRGSAPWWFPGGFRRVEMSDFGFCGPDGVLRPGAESYVKLGEWFKQPRPEKKPDRVVTLDADEFAMGWGHLLRGERKPGDGDKPVDGNGNRLLGEVRGEASVAVQEAARRGEIIAFRTPGTGTNSANMPLVAVGNVPMNGTNPPKYLDAEFNWVEAETEDGTRLRLQNGGTIRAKRLQIRANVGNIQEAAWLKPWDDRDGGVFLVASGPEKARAAISADAESLTDVDTQWMELSAPGEYVLRMSAENRGDFGEVWRLRLEEA